MNATSTIDERVRTYLQESLLTEADRGTLGDDDDLLTVLSSLQLLRMVIELESSFGIKITDAELTADNLGSVRKIATFVERKQRASTEEDRPGPIGQDHLKL